MVYSVGEPTIPYTGVRNAASFQIFAVGAVSFSGEVKENDEVTIKIVDKEYKYKAVKDDGFDQMINGLVAKINEGAGDPSAFATPNTVLQALILTARTPGSDGNGVEYSATASTGATTIVATSGATLSGGQDAAKIAPGTIVSVLGEDLSDGTEWAPADSAVLPSELAGTQVYFDGVAAPLFFVSPTQINAQVPYEFLDTTSINAYVRSKRKDGRISVTTPVAASIVPQNPGIFAIEGNDPRTAVAMSGSPTATGTVSVDGTAKAGDTATVTIEDRSYNYVVKAGDTLASIRDGLIVEINNDPRVEAYAAGVFTRIRLRAREPGAEGNGIPYSAKVNDGAQVILTATTPALCCANEGVITEENPAVPGETIIVYATGLGIPTNTEGVKTGEPFEGPPTEPENSFPHWQVARQPMFCLRV